MGYVTFTAFGVYCADFINDLVNSEHCIYDVTAESDIYTLKTAPHNYPAISRKARTFGVRTKVIERGGIYFRIRRHRNRFGILFGLLAFFGIIVLMSNFIWDVNVSGNEQVGTYRILEQLDKSGIRPGIGIHAYNGNLAELELLIGVDDLAWASIERSGSRINVKVSERLEADEEDIPQSRPTNVVSELSGQLIRADVYRGELLYQEGSGIVAGDVVVSGIVPLPGESGEVSYVHADAVLLIETTKSVDFYQPFSVTHRSKNGRHMNNTSIVFLGRRFGGETQINPCADHIDYSERVYTPKVLGFPLPLRVLEQDYTFRDRVEVIESPTVAREQLDRQIELYEANFILALDSAEIMARQVEYFPDTDGVGALVRYVYRVNAAMKREIMIVE